MERNNWKFRFTASEVCEAAKKKEKHHFSRLTWWEKQQKKVMAEAGKKGIRLDESLAAQYSSSNAGRGASLVIDQTYQKNLNECFYKIQEHREKYQGYASWVEVLSRQDKNHELELHADDYLYFFRTI